MSPDSTGNSTNSKAIQNDFFDATRQREDHQSIFFYCVRNAKTTHIPSSSFQKISLSN